MKKFIAITALCVAGTAAVAGTALAQDQQRVTRTGNIGSADLEQRARAQGITTVKEIEFEGRLAEVEGRDAQGRKVEIVFDRSTGEVLSHKVKRLDL